MSLVMTGGGRRPCGTYGAIGPRTPSEVCGPRWATRLSTSGRDPGSASAGPTVAPAATAHTTSAARDTNRRDMRPRLEAGWLRRAVGPVTNRRTDPLVEEVAQRPSRGPVAARAASSLTGFRDRRQRAFLNQRTDRLVEEVAQRPSRGPVTARAASGLTGFRDRRQRAFLNQRTDP